MKLPFARVSIGKQGDEYVAAGATVRGLGEVHAPSRDDFCAAAGALVFKKNKDVTSVHFTGPGRKYTTLERKPDAV